MQTGFNPETCLHNWPERMFQGPLKSNGWCSNKEEPPNMATIQDILDMVSKGSKIAAIKLAREEGIAEGLLPVNNISFHFAGLEPGLGLKEVKDCVEALGFAVHGTTREAELRQSKADNARLSADNSYLREKLDTVRTKFDSSYRNTGELENRVRELESDLNTTRKAHAKTWDSLSEANNDLLTAQSDLLLAQQIIGKLVIRLGKENVDILDRE